MIMKKDKTKKAVKKRPLPVKKEYNGRVYFTAPPRGGAWCGLNAINNIFGDEVVEPRHFMRSKRQLMKNADTRVKNEGGPPGCATTGVVSIDSAFPFLLLKHIYITISYRLSAPFGSEIYRL
jgi:hypothetical protein